MNQIKILLLLLVLAVAIPVNAQNFDDDYKSHQIEKPLATIIFSNKSTYHMTIKILGLYGGLYETVDLPADFSKIVCFDHTATYKTNIKASFNGGVSYHKGGNFSVTCNEKEWTEGEISYRLAVYGRDLGYKYGRGLGPNISEKEFESNK